MSELKRIEFFYLIKAHVGTEKHIANGYKYNPVHVFAGSAGYI